MIRLLDLPGFRAIEAHAKLNALTGTRVDHDFSHTVDAAIASVLGCQRNPTWALQEYDADHWQPDDEADEDDGLPEVDSWRALAWDITDENGDLLSCFPLFEDALECIELGIDGHPKIEIEASIWKARKANDSPPDPKAAHQNQCFLKLGGRHRS